MTNPKREKPLPKPPQTPFGRKRPEEHREEAGGLLADRLAAAMAEGKVEEFLKKELPDNEYARNLTSMMMGMTGMMPVGPGGAAPVHGTTEETPLNETPAPAGEVPEEVRAAIQSGDVMGLMGLLRKEHQKRTPGAEATAAPEQAETEKPQEPGLPGIDKGTIDSLIRIAQENSVSLDWMILRAIRLYVQDYEKTGRL